ncbi:MAG: ABC transporter ATP-binding protein [Janthinobacterium lividum]
MPILQTLGLSRRFGARTVVHPLDLEIGAGEVVGFVGRNGAGKTTVLRMIAGVLPPSGGAALLCGRDVREARARRALGYLAEGAPAYAEMEVAALLRFVAGVHGLRGGAAVARAVERCDLASVAGRRVGALSKGLRRRVGLAAATLHEPALLVLDEPQDGLDPAQRRGLRAMLAALSPGRAILLSTHLLDEVEAACTRVLVFHGGRLVADGTPAAIAGGHESGLEGAVLALTGT